MNAGYVRANADDVRVNAGDEILHNTYGVTFYSLFVSRVLRCELIVIC